MDETHEEPDENIIDINMIKSEERSPENVPLNFVAVSSITNSTPTRQQTARKRLQINAGGTAQESALLLKRKRFRPIQPKPESSCLVHNFSKPKLTTLKLPTMSNLQPIRPRISVPRQKFKLPIINALEPNTVLVSGSGMLIKKNITPSNVPKEMKNYVRSSSSNNIIVNSNIDESNVNNSNKVNKKIKILNFYHCDTSNNSGNDNIVNPTTEEKIDKTVRIQNSNSKANNKSNNINSNNTNNSSNSSNRECSKNLCSIEVKSQSSKNNIESFFESMAKTVSNLPNEIQEDIKTLVTQIVTDRVKQYYKEKIKLMMED
ncbi:PREDICTED: homeobox protein 4-like [Vollenhovia emeryi]|uniref:homeobox protein 4-like n=1 Tax=Vollenhovia emeryi TaxID=411798 RepID=UPI0005F447B6|nr:PREDICTED: homeobox protein 4-like [Vollenhovia emeryi]XP_011876163.1 PREDICTED: homeobox protein 4-like [Vollenhovia emeryi]XP_011876165.1 PREDICTED: homeobox protein 4-like [Vollenhovia emeryi]XP_011876166.1 PREDICTED: homeobox protein 4-like [Vollenhovia emeryi]XP_011876167.1 PREDICTED: homeobox protein 4-like [Vollenhovia emeryi]XP_011876168.1 PREDICTED: homeobox protein 4-like [Vollenhovia emeryi]XP_011876169.1 PREDICTED: homeobox protein 4-like [Vollenhovia emeryi]XP_011876170.1 PRE